MMKKISNENKISIFNIYWIFMFIGMAIVFLALVLEIFGVVEFVGILLGLLGLVVTIGFGFLSVTKVSIEGMQNSLGSIISTEHEKTRRSFIENIGKMNESNKDEHGKTRHTFIEKLSEISKSS